MTGVELTAVASEFSVISVVFLVMMGGCAFGMALGYPWQWLVAAVVLFLLASGYPGVAMILVGMAVTLRSFAPQVLGWLGSLDIDRKADYAKKTDSRYARTSRTQNRNRAKDQPEQKSGFDNLFGDGAQRKTARPARPKGPTPEIILGLGAGFSKNDLNAARRKLAKKFHPDLHRRASIRKQKRMAEKMRAVNRAYETLRVQTA